MVTNPTIAQPNLPFTERQLSLALRFAAAICALLPLSVGILCYWIPYWVHVQPGEYHEGLLLWCRGYGIAVPPSLSPAAFTTYLGNILLADWAAYAVLLTVAYRVRMEVPRWLLWMGAIVCVLTALIFPPALSGDTYAYVTYGRAQAIHHLNPYTTPIDRLIALHDPFLAQIVDQPHGAKAVYWKGATYYGPVWTMLSTAIAAVTAHLPAMYGVLGFKLVAAGGLFAAAVAVSRIGERLRPGFGTLSFAAVVLNPLALMEGPGQGHNDLLTMALILWALLACLDRKPAAAGLFIGLATAVKLFPIALLPWILWKLREPGKPWLRDTALTVACCVVPLIVGYACYWAGPSMFTSLNTSVGTRTHHSPIGTVLVYLAASAWVLRSKDRGVIFSAWPLVTLMLAFQNTVMIYPWYLLWSIQPACCRWNRLHCVYMTLLCFTAYTWQLLYYAPHV